MIAVTQEGVPVNVREARKRLLGFVGTRHKVRITRRIPKEPTHHGFVLAVGAEWVLLLQMHDFQPDGIAALRIRDIEEMRSGEYERLWERMLAGEGVLDRIPDAADISLRDTADLLRSVQRRGGHVIVECEDLHEDLEDFYIGQILDVDAGAMRFANFDGLGRWDAAPNVIPFDEITKLQIDTPYAQTFSKYLAGPCPHT